ncbi:MAG: transcription antitermination factor NusB [Merdibacter sp.]
MAGAGGHLSGRAYSNLYLQQNLRQSGERPCAGHTDRLWHFAERTPAALAVGDEGQTHAFRAGALLLDLSVYQLLFLERVPDYAVIHEAVRLCEERQKGAKGMVNAVLRRVQREGRRPLPADRWQALGVECSQPDWLIAMWRAQYSDEICERICRSMQQQRGQSVRVNVMKADRNELLKSAHYKEESSVRMRWCACRAMRQRAGNIRKG